MNVSIVELYFEQVFSASDGIDACFNQFLIIYFLLHGLETVSIVVSRYAYYEVIRNADFIRKKNNRPYNTIWSRQSRVYVLILYFNICLF